MNDEQIFRIVIIMLGVLFIPPALFYRLRSQSTGERLDRWQEGVFILFGLRLAGLACWLAIMAYLINPSWMTWAAVPLPVWVRWTGVGFGLCSGILVVWTFHTLGGNLTDTVVTRKNHTLVTSGPYRWVRHPFYDAGALGAVAVSLLAANWLILASGALVLLLLVLRTPIEESKLAARFGNVYQEYRARTGRFIPRISSLPHAPTQAAKDARY